MNHNSRRFGPVFYVTVIAALAILISVPFWHRAAEQWQAWTLSRRLYDPEASARQAAADGLAQLGPAATPWVIRAIRDSDPQVRVMACKILPRTDPDHSGPILDALAAVLVNDSNTSVRKAVADQLWLAGAALAARACPEVRSRAVDALRTALGDQVKDVRVAAANTLSAFGESAKSAVADLDGVLSGPDHALRVAAAQALLRIDPSRSRPRVISTLRDLIADPSAMFERYQAVQTLKETIGEDGAATELIPLLRHQDMGIRHSAIYHLIIQCPGAASTKKALLDALRDDDGGLRCDAAFFFLEREPEMVSRALDTLIEQLVNPRDGSSLPWDIIPKIRQTSPASVERLVARLIEPLSRSESPECRLNAILSLSLIGRPEAKSAVPALRKAGESNDRAVAARAVEALAKIDPASAESFMPSLLEWTQPAEDIQIRLTAMATLGELGLPAKAAVPALLKAADEEEVRVSAAAISALSRIDPTKAAALKRSIRDGD